MSLRPHDTAGHGRKPASVFRRHSYRLAEQNLLLPAANQLSTRSGEWHHCAPRRLLEFRLRPGLQHSIDLTKTPIITWRWKISNIYPNLDPHAKSGDDYPARVYVITGNPLLPWTVRSLVYVWANGPVRAPVHGPQGTPFYPDPYTAQAEIVALRQGPAGAGVWATEQRKIVSRRVV